LVSVLVEKGVSTTATGGFKTPAAAAFGGSSPRSSGVVGAPPRADGAAKGHLVESNERT